MCSSHPAAFVQRILSYRCCHHHGTASLIEMRLMIASHERCQSLPHRSNSNPIDASGQVAADQSPITACLVASTATDRCHSSNNVSLRSPRSRRPSLVFSSDSHRLKSFLITSGYDPRVFNDGGDGRRKEGLQTLLLLLQSVVHWQRRRRSSRPLQATPSNH